MHPPPRPFGNWLTAGTAAAVVAGAWALASWRLDFNLSDEGFYWYGAQRILQGELPFRDFMSYDVGRYLLAAAVMWLAGDDGIVAARVAGSLVHVAAVALALGLWLPCLDDRTGRVARWTLATLGAAILTLWFWPYYKSFDHAASAAAVGAGLLLLRARTAWGWFGSGLLVGLVAVMGRNHGVYAGVTCLLLLPMVRRGGGGTQPSRGSLVAWLAGVALGFSPNLLLMAGAESFASAFLDSVLLIFQLGQTNLGLPVPWPWVAPKEYPGGLIRLGQVLQGAAFLLLVAFPVLALAWLWKRRWRYEGWREQLVVAAAAAAVPYSHYAFSRPDITHLTLGIVPALIGAAALLSRQSTARVLLLSACALCATVLVMGRAQPLLSLHAFGASMVPVTVQGQQLWASKRTAQRLAAAQWALKGQVQPSLLAVPDLMGLYAVYRVASPTWEIYPLFRRNAAFERSELERLQQQQPDWVMISDHALDGNADLRFSRLRPTIHRWIGSGYIAVEPPVPVDGDLTLLRRKP